MALLLRKLLITHTVLSCILLLFFTSGCTKTEVQKTDYKGNLKVQIFTASEFFQQTFDHEGFTVILKGTSPEMSSVTNASGSCLFENVPMGNYMLLVQKEGYGLYTTYNVGLLENSTTDSIPVYVVHQSTTRIKSYNLTFSNDAIHINANIAHNYDQFPQKYYAGVWPVVQVYISDKPTVSSSEYLRSYRFYATEENDTIVSQSIETISLSQASGKQFYVIIYGTNWDPFYRFFDYQTRKYYYPTLGAPSEIKSVLIP